MRPYGHARTSDRLGRYYTSGTISNCLINSIEDLDPHAVVDLGAGRGALSLAASKRWSNTRLATVDIDRTASGILAQRLNEAGFDGNHHHIGADALSLALPSRIRKAMGGAPTLAVCNPPFLIPVWRDCYWDIAEEAGLSSSLPPPSTTDAALLFLAQNLRVVEDGGTVAMIVPDSLACAGKYASLRRALMSNFDLQHSIKLPPMSFSGTEARAHILIVRKSPASTEKVKLSVMDGRSGSLRTIEVERGCAHRRLDIDVYQQKAMVRRATLGDIALDIRRGSLNSVEVKCSPDRVLHTTNISEDMSGRWIVLPRTKQVTTSTLDGTWACTGDIIIGRVGRNAFEKVVGIRSGSMKVSDCLFRIRVPKAYQRAVLELLSSEAGRSWLKTNSHGVAARHISKSELLKFPLEV